jgi:hypothetical protein
VAGRQEDAASGLALPDNVASGGGRQDAVLADQELLDAIRRTNLGDQLDNLGVPVPPIAANDEEGIFENTLVSYSTSRKIMASGPGRRSTSPLTPSGIDSRMLVTKDSL